MLYSLSDIRILTEALDHPEGIAVGRDGMVYAGGEAGQVYRITPDGKRVDTFAQTAGFCLGITLDADENLYICDAGRRSILQVNQDGDVCLVLDSVNGRKLICPNFSVFDSRGNLYFSDSGEWKRANGHIYRLSSHGLPEVFAEGPFHFPNGMALDSTETHLYVVESNLDRVLKIEITPDGHAGAIEVFANGLSDVPDGLAFDQEGNLYVTAYASNCIYRVTPQRWAEVLCRDVECALLSQPTNCAFGGPGFDKLLVANLGRHHISVLDLKRKGQPLVQHSCR